MEDKDLSSGQRTADSGQPRKVSNLRHTVNRLDTYLSDGMSSPGVLGYRRRRSPGGALSAGYPRSRSTS